METSFNNLPQAVQQLSDKLDYIERLLSFINPHPEQPESDQWFDINELCSYHPDKPKKSTVYRWVREKKIPYHKKGKKLAFLKSEIDEHIKSGRVKTQSEIEQEAEDYLVNKKRKG